MPFESYLRLLELVPALEVRNGAMLRVHNMLIERVIEQGVGARRLGMVAGSDAHTLRRIGRTWTSAPGQTREAFLSSLKQGLGRPGGAHGGAGAVAGDASGVIALYIAALAGLGPRDVRGWRRAGCLAFSALSLPAQFVIPAAVAAIGKSRERREVRRALAYLENAGHHVPAASWRSETEA